MEHPSEDSTGRKRALRQEMLARRESVPAAEHARWSAQIVAHALAALPRPRIAAFCWPVRNEPDVRALLAAWGSSGTIAALPVVVADGEPLAFRCWTTQTLLLPDRYGIPTPASGEFVRPDLILLPLNGFDADGYRLGYGGGYFDRTLAALVPRPLAVGVGFEINRVNSVAPQAHDQRLDWIVSEAGAFRIRAA